MVRLKNRYLLVNIIYPDSQGSFPAAKVPDLVTLHQPTTDDLTPNILLKAIRAEVAELFGDYGSGAVADSLQVKYLSPATSTFIIRVSRAHYRITWAALSLMSALPLRNGRGCLFQVIRVSGTVRKAEQEAIRTAREMILRARREMSDQSSATLESIITKSKTALLPNSDIDIFRVDRSGSEEDLSYGNG